MAWFVSCSFPSNARGFMSTDPVLRARTHASEAAAKEHARIILRLLPRARVEIKALNASDSSQLVTPETMRAWHATP